MIRFFLLSVLLLLSLLTLFKAPTYHLWLLAILVSEFSAFFIFITLILLCWGTGSTKFQLAGTIAGVGALLLYLNPICGAVWIARQLPAKLAEALHQPVTDKPVLNFLKIFTHAGQSGIVPSTFSYTMYEGKALMLDFYRSKSAGKRPCVIAIHGGSWKGGSRDQLPELNSSLAEAGYHVAVISYRLAPEYTSPAQVNDVSAAIRFVKAHAEELQVDTSCLVLLGRSAGAQIALLAAYTLEEPGIKGVIDFYGPADMVWGYSLPANPLVLDSRKVMEDYIGGTYRQVPNKYEESSPINFVGKSSVPTLIIHGRNDVLVAYEHSVRLSKKLKANGIPCYFLTLPWATHGFDYSLNGPGGQLSTFAVQQFMEKVSR